VVDKGKVKIEVHERSVVLDGRLRAHVQRQLDFALSGFGELVLGVTVRLSSAEPQRGEAAKRCEIEAALRPRSVRAEDTDVDLFVAVDNAARRLQRTVGRAVEQEHDHADGPARATAQVAAPPARGRGRRPAPEPKPPAKM
jgi:ribosomal subunit interface protein